jgi:secondary thiamine-phosphate synthase enzyme
MTGMVTVDTSGPGLTEITERVAALVRESGRTEGLCTLMIQHTSASLTIQENADPSARRDLHEWLSRLVSENDPHFTHTSEGPDDMPSHIKAALTSTTLSSLHWRGDAESPDRQAPLRPLTSLPAVGAAGPRTRGEPM